MSGINELLQNIVQAKKLIDFYRSELKRQELTLNNLLSTLESEIQQAKDNRLRHLEQENTELKQKGEKDGEQ